MSLLFFLSHSLKIAWNIYLGFLFEVLPFLLSLFIFSISVNFCSWIFVLLEFLWSRSKSAAINGVRVLIPTLPSEFRLINSLRSLGFLCELRELLIQVLEFPVFLFLGFSFYFVLDFRRLWIAHLILNYWLFVMKFDVLFRIIWVDAMWINLVLYEWELKLNFGNFGIWDINNWMMAFGILFIYSELCSKFRILRQIDG